MRIYLIFFLFLHHTISFSQEEKKESDFFRDGTLESKIANLGPGCRFKIKIPSGSNFNYRYQNNQYKGIAEFSIKMPSNFSDDGTWGGGFGCYRIDDKKFQQIWMATSPQNGRMPNPSDFIKNFKNEEGATFIPIKSINSEGWALTYDDTAGDEKYRLRHLRYCLIKNKNAICGGSEIGYIDFLNNKNNIDVSFYALKILRSIEFLEESIN